MPPTLELQMVLRLVPEIPSMDRGSQGIYNGIHKGTTPTKGLVKFSNILRGGGGGGGEIKKSFYVGVIQCMLQREFTHTKRKDVN